MKALEECFWSYKGIRGDESSEPNALEPESRNYTEHEPHT